MAQNPIQEKGFSIGVSPLNLIEPVTNTFELVGEYAINAKYRIELKAGLPVGQFFNPLGKKAYWRNMHETGNYYELKAAVKRMFLYKDFFSKIPYQMSFNLEVNYLNNKYVKTDDWYTKNSEYYFYDEAIVKRSAIGAGISISAYSIFSDKFSIDFSTGFGVRNMRYIYDSKNEYIGEPYISRDTLPFVPIPENVKYEGNKAKAYLIFNFRLMYRLAKRGE